MKILSGINSGFMHSELKAEKIFLQSAVHSTQSSTRLVAPGNTLACNLLWDLHAPGVHSFLVFCSHTAHALSPKMILQVLHTQDCAAVLLSHSILRCASCPSLGNTHTNLLICSERDRICDMLLELSSCHKALAKSLQQY